jgi:GAF domain-containing protein
VDEGQALRTAQDRIRELERETARLHRKLAEQQQLANTARVASITVLEALDLPEVLDTLLDCLAQGVPFDAGCVLLCDDQDPERLVMQAGVGYDGFEAGAVSFTTRDRPHLRRVIEGRASVRLDDTWADPGWQRGVVVSEETRSWLGVPLVARGQVLGMFGLDKRERSGFHDDHQRLAELLAAHAALAIANARMCGRMRERLASRGGAP